MSRYRGPILKIKQHTESKLDYSNTFLFAGIALGIALSAVVIAVVGFFVP